MDHRQHPPRPRSLQPAARYGLSFAAGRVAFGVSTDAGAIGGPVAGAVDVYTVLQRPGGGYLSLQLTGALVPGLVPLARAMVVPDATVSFAFVVPAGAAPGGYAWLTAAASPGSLALVTPVTATAFEIVP